MLRLLTQTLENAQAGTATLIGTLAGLEEYERDAVEGFLKHPNGKNVNTLVTYASVESETVEQAFTSLPDLLVWKEEGKWHLLLDDWS